MAGHDVFTIDIDSDDNDISEAAGHGVVFSPGVAGAVADGKDGSSAAAPGVSAAYAPPAQTVLAAQQQQQQQQQQWQLQHNNSSGIQPDRASKALSAAMAAAGASAAPFGNTANPVALYSPTAGSTSAVHENHNTGVAAYNTGTAGSAPATPHGSNPSIAAFNNPPRPPPPHPKLKYLDQSKILILFDLNGVLTDHTPARQEGKYLVRDHVVRPHIEEILRLLPHFTLGIFSSATKRTVNTALGVIHRRLLEVAAQKGTGLYVPPVYEIFRIICDRNSCQPDPHWRSRADGKEWDTIKPLGRQGFNLSRTILVDNDHYKSAAGEHDNMLLVPHWEQEPVSNRDFPILVQLLLQRFVPEQGDVRPHLEPIRQQLLQLREIQPPQSPAPELEGLMQEDVEQQQQQQLADFAQSGHLQGLATDQQQQQRQHDASKKAQKRQRAEQPRGFRIEGLAEAPEHVQQLVQLIGRYSSSNAGEAGGSNTDMHGAVVDIEALIAAAMQQLADSAVAGLDATIAAQHYKQHLLNVLLAAVWSACFSMPHGVTLQQVLLLLTAKGYPTDVVADTLDVMLTRGDITLWQQQQQQDQQLQLLQPQLQQHQWPWPLPAGYWPAGPVVTAAAATRGTFQQQQQQYEWQDRVLVPMLHLRSFSGIKKSLAAVSELMQQGPEAVKTALGGYGSKPLPGLGPKPQSTAAAAGGENRDAAAGQSDGQPNDGSDAEQLSYPRTQHLRDNNPQLMHLRNYVCIGMRDVFTLAKGIMLTQLLAFIQGFKPAVAQQLLGASQQQQQQQRLQELLQALAELSAANASQQQQQQQQVPDAQQQQQQLLQQQPSSGLVLGLKIEPWRQPESQEHYRDTYLDQLAEQCRQEQNAAIPQLTRYLCTVVPDAAAVEQSLVVLEAAAAAAAARSSEQLQQLYCLLSQPPLPVVRDLLQPQWNGHPPQQPAAGAGRKKRGKHMMAAGEADAAEYAEQNLAQMLPGDSDKMQQEQQQQAGGCSDADLNLAKRKADNDEDDEQPQEGADSGRKRPRSSCQQQQHEEEQEAVEGQQQADGHQGPGAVPTTAAAGEGQQQPGLASEFWLDQQQQQQPQAEQQPQPQDHDQEHASPKRKPQPQMGFARSPWQEQQMKQHQQQAPEQQAAAAAAVVASGSGDDVDVVDDDALLTDGMGSSSDSEQDSQGADGVEDGQVPVDDVDADDEELLSNSDSGSSDGESSSSSDGGDDDDDDSLDANGIAEGLGVDLDAEGHLDDLYAADEAAMLEEERAAGEEAGWHTDDEADNDSDAGNDDNSGSEVSFDDDAGDGQLQLGVEGLEGLDALDEVYATVTFEQLEAQDQPSSGGGSSTPHIRRRQQQPMPGGRPLHDELHAAVAAAVAAVSAGQQQQHAATSSRHATSSSGAGQFSALHSELLRFSAAAAPCAVERLILLCAVSQLQQVAQQIWREAEAVLFGSQATGLALPGSDLDVVLLGTPCPKTKNAAEGYSVKNRMKVKKMLQTLKAALIRAGLATYKSLNIIDARVPLVKGTMKFTVEESDVLDALAADEQAVSEAVRSAAAAAGTSGATAAAAAAPGGSVGQCSPLSAVVAMIRDAARRCGIGAAAVGQQHQHQARRVWVVELPVDLSLGVTNGAAAVDFMTRQVRAMPPLRPLVLVIKALLKEAGLNEVFTGGVSSYSLVNMVVAHLQAEGLTAAPVRPPGASSSSSNDIVISQEQVQQHLAEIACNAAAAAAAGSAGSSSSSKQWDLGCLLHGFFVRFGEVFNYSNEAVSVAFGGIIAKIERWIKPGNTYLLSVEDPQSCGRDIASASRAVQDVAAAFAWAADSIRKMVDFYEGTVEGRQQLAAAAAPVPQVTAGSTGGTAAAAAAAAAVMTEEQRWAAVQSKGQSQSVTLPLHPLQQQYDQAAAQQQLLHGYTFLGNLIDVWGALGRGHAAEAHRQHLVAAAAAARNAKGSMPVQQQAHGMALLVQDAQGHVQGVKLGAKKSKLKVAGLDNVQHAQQQAAKQPRQLISLEKAFEKLPPVLFGADDNIRRYLNMKRRARAVAERFNGALAGLAAAENALGSNDFPAAAAGIQAAQGSLVPAITSALQGDASSNAQDLADMEQLAQKFSTVCKRLLNMSSTLNQATSSKAARKRPAAAAAAAQAAAAAVAVDECVKPVTEAANALFVKNGERHKTARKRAAAAKGVPERADATVVVRVAFGKVAYEAGYRALPVLHQLLKKLHVPDNQLEKQPQQQQQCQMVQQQQQQQAKPGKKLSKKAAARAAGEPSPRQKKRAKKNANRAAGQLATFSARKAGRQQQQQHPNQQQPVKGKKRQGAPGQYGGSKKRKGGGGGGGGGRGWGYND